jgi:hypothetical protein
MKRVTGIGGIFFKAKDAPALQAWQTAPGNRCPGLGWSCPRLDRRRGQAGCRHNCLVNRSHDSDHFAPSSASFMVNYRVEDLLALVKALKEEGATCSRRSTTPTMGSLHGSWIQRETRSSYGSRLKANERLSPRI